MNTITVTVTNPAGEQLFKLTTAVPAEDVLEPGKVGLGTALVLQALGSLLSQA